MPDEIFSHGRWSFDAARRELRLDGQKVALGRDGIAVLEALILAGGRPIVLQDLAALIPSYETGDTSRLRAAVASIHEALGDSRGLLVAIPGGGFHLAGDWRAQRNPQADQPHGHLPLEPGLLFGREAMIRQTTELLRTHRMVTLTGPGGVGKSRLALAVAHRRVAETGEPALLVELASLADDRFVLSTVAAALGLDVADATTSPATIVAAIGERPLVLLLDNCEHVLEAAASLADALVLACAGLTILATSRESLGHRDEQVVVVPPLAIPPEDADPADRRYDAVDFFMARIEALGAAAQAAGWNPTTLAAVCRRLDGIPLAIEIAAACAATMGIETVLAHAAEGLDLPTGGRRARAPRQQTLRATFDWSYRLLSDDAKRLLRALGVFAGSFTFEAAAAVNGVTPGDAWSVLDGISDLAAKSLIHSEDAYQGRRWRLHEMTRAYALEQLGAADETHQAMQRLTYFLRDLLSRQPMSPALFAREIGNIRVALDWAFRPGGEAAAGVALTAICVPLLLKSGLQQECRERAEQALVYLEAEPGEDDDVTVRAFVEVAVALVYTTELAEGSGPLLSRVQAMAARHGERNTLLRAIWANLIYQLNTGALDEADVAAEAFRDAATAGNDPADISLAETMQGAVRFQQGAFREASHCFSRMLVTYQAPADGRHPALFIHDQEIFTRGALALTLFLQGEFQRADDLVARCLHASADAADIHERRHLLGRTVVPIALEAGNLAAAQLYLAMLEDLARPQGAIYYRTISQGLQGLLLCRQGDFAAALAALRLCSETCLNRRWLMMHPWFSGGIAASLAGLGRVEEALRTVENTIAWSERSGNRWYLAELHRLRGEALLPSERAAARTCFADAAALAAAHGARLWHMRAATCLARWHAQAGERIAARACLAPVVASFAADVTNTDLQAAKVLLADISSG